MIQSAFNMNPGLPGTVIGGVPAMGLAGAPLNAPLYDIDPISPGIQAQKGILTATGPSRIVPVGPMGTMGGQLMTSGFAVPQGFGSAYGGLGFRTSGLGMVDADPITPGIQAQPGIVTAVGPPRVVGGPGFVAGGMTGGLMTSGLMTSGVMASGVLNSGYRGVGVQGVNTTFGGGLLGGGVMVDADPITPGIQAQPGFVTQTGPAMVVGNTGAVGGALSNALGGTMLGSRLRGSGVIGFDADPITPGIQTQPGVVTPIGPTQVVGSVGYGSGIYGTQSYVGGNCWNCCPWWLWIALGLLLLGAFLGGLFLLNQQNQKQVSKKSRSTITTEDFEDDNQDTTNKNTVKTIKQVDEQTQTVNTKPKITIEENKQNDQNLNNIKAQNSTTTEIITNTNTRHPPSPTPIPPVIPVTVPTAPVETNISENTSTTTSTNTNSDIPVNTSTNIQTSTNTTQKTPQPQPTPIPTPVPTVIPTPVPVPQTQLTTSNTNNQLDNKQNSNGNNKNSNQNSNSEKSSNSSSSSGSTKRLNRKKKTVYLKRTVTKTIFQNQIVDPIMSEPTYVPKHLKRVSH